MWIAQQPILPHKQIDNPSSILDSFTHRHCGLRLITKARVLIQTISGIPSVWLQNKFLVISCRFIMFSFVFSLLCIEVLYFCCSPFNLFLNCGSILVFQYSCRFCACFCSYLQRVPHIFSPLFYS